MKCRRFEFPDITGSRPGLSRPAPRSTTAPVLSSASPTDRSFLAVASAKETASKESSRSSGLVGLQEASANPEVARELVQDHRDRDSALH